MAADSKSSRVEQDIAEPLPADWPAWIDKHRFMLGGLVIVVLFIVYGYLVYVSGERQLNGAEQVSLAVIGIIVSSTFGVMIGIPLAKRRIRIASQLRRAYSIRGTLKNAQSSILESEARMESRSRYDSRTINDFWKEITFSVVGALNAALLESERIIEDWGEIDPDERNRIKRVEDKRQGEIDDLNRQLIIARMVERELEGVADLGSLPSSIERAIKSARSQSGSGDEYVAGSAKAFVQQGDYEKAIEAYSRVISMHPTVHTNYIGRARARMLAGDSEGALVDLRKALDMSPGDKVALRLRAQIEGGDLPTAPLETTAQGEASKAHSFLASGQLDAAQEHYDKSESLGLKSVYVSFNRSMVQFAKQEYEHARSSIDEYTPYGGTNVAVNTYALLAMIDIAQEQDSVTNERNMDANLFALVEYDFNQSPLQFLETFLSKNDLALYNSVAHIFGKLKAGLSAAA